MPARKPQRKAKVPAPREPNSPIGFAGRPVREQPTAAEPKRVPLGFSPTQTTEQIEIAR